jgi:hypothetical protein
MNLFRPVKRRKCYLLRRSYDIYFMRSNVQKMNGFNLRASCQFSAAKLRFILKLVLTAAQLMRKASANGSVELPSNTVPKQCRSFPSSYRPRTTVPSPNSTPFSQLFGKLFSWIENSDWKRS